MLAAAVSPAGAAADGLVAARQQSAQSAQSDDPSDPAVESERSLVERTTTRSVDAVVIALFSVAGVMTVMLVLFLWHTSPRRRLRMARRRSVELYGTQNDQAEPVDQPEPVEPVESAVAAGRAKPAEQSAPRALPGG